MRLTYKILWFEDDEGFFEFLRRDEIKRHLDEKGFNTEIQRMGGGEDLQTILSEAQKADLLVMDYGLEESHFGDEITRQVRDGNINTEVVLYSARGVSDLRRYVYEKELDGVYCRPRDGITQEVLPIIDSTIKKILDLENSRGLVMTELGELDIIMNEIIMSVHDSSEDRQAFIRGKLKERLDSQLKSLSERVENFDSLGTNDLIEEIDSSKRLSMMLSICRTFNLSPQRKKLAGFDEKVLFPRNCLGHGIPEVIEGGYVFHHRGKDFIYNDQTSAALRNEFREFRRSLESLREEILKLVALASQS
jgi:hypothetical protein